MHNVRAASRGSGYIRGGCARCRDPRLRARLLRCRRRRQPCAANAASETLAVAEAASDDYQSLLRESRTLPSRSARVATVYFKAPPCMSVLEQVVDDSDVYATSSSPRADETIVCYGQPDPEPIDPTAEPYRDASPPASSQSATFNPATPRPRRTSPPRWRSRTVGGVYIISALLDLERDADLIASISLPEDLSMLLLNAVDRVLLTRGDSGAAIGEDISDSDIANQLRRTANGSINADGPDGVRRIYRVQPVRTAARIRRPRRAPDQRRVCRIRTPISVPDHRPQPRRAPSRSPLP